ncbi:MULTISPECIES: tetratricopeptide repeat protein [unclassified Halorhodospira]|uniref:tetratricopeptide repeat protein n=1 Tax=unclassified Halorhodospira TaxID=2626748 RepID=UPI001EE95CA5|nr:MULTISPECIES: tetratricopeptide repeat protein [unclassified Halorhodospira]MCG5540270.1 tetratricopeptide repeat protein [Halorhodospira sp. M39old]MCG5545808.1 tetratricopeptide repeat protein [Halorhodospira sp. M38]
MIKRTGLCALSLLFGSNLVQAEPDPPDTGIEIESGDTLWDLAAEHLGNPLLYPWIWQANPTIADPARIRSGDRLALPQSPRIPPALRPETPHAEPPAPPTPATAPPARQVARDIRLAVEAGDYEQAVALSRDHEALTGVPVYDFEAGRAYLRSGDIDEAVVHFDRAVMVAPDAPRYRLEYARALFAAEDHAASQRQFKRVLETEEVPEPVAQNIQRFLEAIDARLTSRRPETRAQAAIAAGYDSNPLYSADDEFLFLGFFPVDFERESDTFLDTRARVEHRRPRTRTSSYQYLGEIEHRHHSDVSAADQTEARLRGGLAFEGSEGRSYRVPLELRHTRLDGDSFRTRLAFAPEAVLPRGPTRQLRVQGQLAYADYDNDDRDALTLGASATSLHVLDPQSALLFYAGVATSYDAADEDEFTKARAGGFLGLQRAFFEDTTASVTATASHERAREARSTLAAFPDEDNGAERATTYELRGALAHPLGDSGFTAFTEGAVREKQSNIDLFEFTQREIFAGVRYDY